MQVTGGINQFVKWLWLCVILETTEDLTKKENIYGIVLETSGG